MINEASITGSNTYGPGHKLVLKESPVNSANKELTNMGYSINSDFEISKEVNDYIEIGQGKETIYIKEMTTNRTFKINGSRSFLNNIFNHANINKRVLPKGVNPTNFLETFATLGVMGIKTFEEALSYNNEELQIDLKKFSNTDKETIDEAEKLLKGGNKSPFKKPDSFIHKNIKDYYRALEKYENIKKAVKDNTSDVVFIYGGSPKDLFNNLKSNIPNQFDKETGLITLGNISFFQVSLKKGADKARLGRITTLIRQTYDINEGLLDRIKNVGTLGFKAFSFIKSKVQKFLTILTETFATKKLELELEKFTKKYLKKHKFLVENNETENIVNSINNSFAEISRVKGIKTKIIQTDLKECKTKSETNLLICNDISLSYLNKILLDISKSDAPKYIAKTIELMRKGETNLPVVMMYGDGSTDVLVSVDAVVPSGGQIPTVILSITPAKSASYYVISLYYLVGIDANPELSKYILIQFNNAGGASKIAWKVEGNSVKTLKQIKI